MRTSPFLRSLAAALIGGVLLLGAPVHAQTYPPTPPFETVVKDAQKDGVLDTLKGLGVPEAHLKAVKFEKINAQDRRNFKTDVSYYKENARKFDDRMISWIIAVVPKAALGASFRVPVAVHYTRYVESNDNWSLLNKWQFHSTVHGLDVMVSPPDLGMPADAAKVAAIDAFFASKPDLSNHRLLTRNILSVQKAGIYTAHSELGVNEAQDLKTFVWRLAARVELAKERNEEGITESTFDNLMFKFLAERTPDGRFTVTKLDTIGECSESEALAAGIGGEERKEVVNPSPLKVGNMRSAGWAAVQKRRAPFTEELGSHEHLKRMAAQFEAVLKGFRFQAASEARALDAWTAPDSEFKADEAWQQLMDRVTVRAIEEQAAGAPFTFQGAQVVSSTVESAHRPESGDSFRTIPAMGQVQYVFKYKVQYRLENKPRELDAEVTVDAGFYGVGDKFLASKFEVH